MATIDGLPDPGAGVGPPGHTASAGPGTRGPLLVGLGAVLWGTGGVTGAALADAAGWASPAVATARLLSGALFLALVLLVTNVGRRTTRSVRTALPVPGGQPRSSVRPRLGRPAARRVVVVGLLLATYQAAYFASVATWGVARATLVALGGAPVVLAVARAVRDRRRPDAGTATAVGLGVVGLTLLVLPALLAGGGDGTGWHGGDGSGAADRDAVVRGALLAAGAAVTFAVVTVVNRRPVPGLAPVTMTGAAFAVGGAALLPLAFLGQVWLGRPRGPAGTGVAGAEVDVGVVIGLVLLLGALPTAAAWVAYFSGLPHVPAQRATVLALLEPLTATVAATLLLGEPLGVPAVLGGALLLASTTLAARPPAGRVRRPR